ncbi:MAG TPA: CPBP family intramembrane metalloprotease [Chloroflexota bacterium]|nr:CPBP family intramembrane metalloprotease [Chloroflexota bacterium]
MNKINSLAAQRPLLFGVVVTSVFVLMVLISAIVVGLIWPAETPGWFIGSTIGRLFSTFILLVALSGLGWLRSAGFTRLGRWQMWLSSLLALAYAIVASAYAMTGTLDFNLSDATWTGLVTVFLLAHAFLEEATFRGLILHGFVRTWGSTNRGLVQSVLVSALYFGGMHLIYLTGEPLSVVFWRMVTASLLGILFAALVLRGSSIYPAVFLHGFLNLGGYLNLTSNAVEGTTASWLRLSLFILPLALYGFYFLHDLSRQSNLPMSHQYPAR